MNVFWQGPYEVVGGDGPTSYSVRLLGDTEVSQVHWRKLRRLAGPEFTPDEEVIASALHDRQRFKVQQFDDWIVDEGEAELLVRWKNHSEEERTWEPLLQLLQDVPEMVKKYVTQVDVEKLTTAWQDAKAELEVTATAPVRPDSTTAQQHAAGAAAERASARNSAVPTSAPTAETSRVNANAARDARAAARASRK